MNAQQGPSEPAPPIADEASSAFELTSPPSESAPSDLRLSTAAAEQIRADVAKAGGREVCFLARVDADRRLVEVRAVARGNQAAVLAAGRDADEGSVMIHNHPSGELEPSDADLGVAARLYEEGIGTAITNNGADGLFVVVLSLIHI